MYSPDLDNWGVETLRERSASQTASIIAAAQNEMAVQKAWKAEFRVAWQKTAEYAIVLEHFCNRFPDKKKSYFEKHLYSVFIVKAGMMKLWFKLFGKGHLEENEISKWLQRAMGVKVEETRKLSWTWVGIINTWNDDKLPEQKSKAMIDNIEKRLDSLVAVSKYNPSSLTPGELSYADARVKYLKKRNRKSDRQKAAMHKRSMKTINLVSSCLETNQKPPTTIEAVVMYIVHVTDRQWDENLTHTVKLALRRLVEKNLAVRVSRGLYDCLPENRKSQKP